MSCNTQQSLIMKVAIITGGSSGIGLSTARLFSEHGYTVYELSRHGQDKEAVRHMDCDVTKPDQCQQAIMQIWKQEGSIDTVVCNAGYGISGAIEFTDIADAHQQFDVNYFGALHITQAVLPYLRHQKSGHIIFVSSVMAVFSLPYQSFYAASKAAINMLASALRNEVRSFNIQVSCVMPGDVRTSFTQVRKKDIRGAGIYPRMKASVAKMEEDEQLGMPPSAVARVIYRHASCSHPALLTTVGWSYRLLVILQRFLPSSLVNRLVYYLY